MQREDVQAYFELTQARADGDPAGLKAAVKAAVDCPWRIMERARESLQILAVVGGGCKRHLVSDALVACEMLAAVLAGACYIARANLPLLPKGADRDPLAESLSQALSAGQAAFQETREHLLKRLT